MVTKISKSYKLLFEFSGRLDALAVLFRKPAKDQEFAKVLPRIYYEIDVIRHMEFILRDRIFKGKDAENAFVQVDLALYHAEYVLHGPDQGLDEFPSDRYNMEISKELKDAVHYVNSMSTGRQAQLGAFQAPIPANSNLNYNIYHSNYKTGNLQVW